MAGEAWSQEKIRESYARELLKEKYRDGYDYFLIFDFNDPMIAGISKADPSNKFEIPLEPDTPVLEPYTYDDQKEFIYAGGSIEEYKKLKRKSRLVQFIVWPVIIFLLAASFAFLKIST